MRLIKSLMRESISAKLLPKKLVADIGRDADRPPHETLSDREFEVLRLIASGKTAGEIAKLLSLSDSTISTYRARILEKMGMKTNAELTHYAMPALNGLEVTRHLQKTFPNVRVVILSMYSDEQHLHLALCAGAAGYLIKGAAREELPLAIRAVARGDRYLSPPLTKLMIMKSG